MEEVEGGKGKSRWSSPSMQAIDRRCRRVGGDGVLLRVVKK